MKRLVIRLLVGLGLIAPVAAHTDGIYTDGHMMPWFFGFGIWHMLIWVIIIALAIYGAIKLFENRSKKK